MLLQFCQMTDGSTQLGRFERGLGRYTAAADGSRAGYISAGRQTHSLTTSSIIRRCSDAISAENARGCAGANAAVSQVHTTVSCHA